MHDPSASQSLPRLGCLGGTFSLSRRQMRSTRLSVIIQPLAQELGDLAIAIAAVLPGKLDDIGGETLLFVTAARDLALRRCPSAAQARRSETCSCTRTCSIQARRRAGLRSFPGQPPAE